MYKFEKLIVWQKALELIQTTYVLSDSLPKQEEHNLKSQLKRAVVSVSLNIAEGAGAENDREFKRFLHIARKSLFEVVAVLKVAEFLYKTDIKSISVKVDEVSRMLTSLIKKLKIS